MVGQWVTTSVGFTTTCGRAIFVRWVSSEPIPKQGWTWDWSEWQIWSFWLCSFGARTLKERSRGVPESGTWSSKHRTWYTSRIQTKPACMLSSPTFSVCLIQYILLLLQNFLLMLMLSSNAFWRNLDHRIALWHGVKAGWLTKHGRAISILIVEGGSFLCWLFFTLLLLTPRGCILKL